MRFELSSASRFYVTGVSDSDYQSTLDAVYVYVVPWSELPVVPSYSHHPQQRHHTVYASSGSPLSSELRTYKPVKARFWNWLEFFFGENLGTFLSCSLLAQPRETAGAFGVQFLNIKNYIIM